MSKFFSDNAQKLLQHETRFSIVMFLIIFGELSLSKLASLVDKTKPTVHHHLQLLITEGIVKEIENLERNQFDPKYYQLNLDISNLFFSEEDRKRLSDKKFHEIIEYYRGGKYSLQMISNLFSLMVKHSENIEKNIDIFLMIKNEEEVRKNAAYQQLLRIVKNTRTFSLAVDEDIHNKYIEKFVNLAGEMLIELAEKQKAGTLKELSYLLVLADLPLLDFLKE